MKHEPKTIHLEDRSSFAGSLVTIYAGQGARAAESKTTRETLPGKSRVGRILLNDNNSQDRLLDMKLADIQQMQRKAETFITHQQKTFITRMEKRQDTWVREHTRFSNSTNLVRPPDEILEDPPPTRDTIGTRYAEDAGVAEGNVRLGTAPGKGDPEMTYLTEAAENTPRDNDLGVTTFAKEPDPFERAPRMFVGLPPIARARKSGFQPSGSIDDIFDDKAMKRGLWRRPQSKGEGFRGSKTPSQANNLPALDPNDPNAVTAGNESRLSAIQPEMAEEEPDKCSPTPLFILSRSLPRIQLEEPQSRKILARRLNQPKVRRKRSRHLSDVVNDNPLGDERFVKLHQLLATDVVANHETRELSAIARGFLAAKRFGQNWKEA